MSWRRGNMARLRVLGHGRLSEDWSGSVGCIILIRSKMYMLHSTMRYESRSALIQCLTSLIAQGPRYHWSLQHPASCSCIRLSVRSRLSQQCLLSFDQLPQTRFLDRNLHRRQPAVYHLVSAITRGQQLKAYLANLVTALRLYA